MAVRGQIHSRRRAKQLVNLSKMRWGKITPTDLDSVIDFGNKATVIVEYKLDGNDCPRGQQLAIERSVEDAHKAGKHGLAIIATHQQENPDDDIDGASAKVRSYMPRRKNIAYSDKWRTPRREISTKEMIDKFLDKIGLGFYVQS